MSTATEARHTVATLVAAVPDSDLVAALGRLYWADQDKQSDAYLEVLAKLRTMTPQPSTMDCVLARAMSEDDPPEPLVHVYGVQMGDSQRWGLDFRPWAEWLGMAVKAEPELELSDADMLANILYEMTFVGWDDEEIQAEFGKLKEAVEEIDRGEAELIEVKGLGDPDKS